MIKRLIAIFDALSQLANVALLPRLHETTPNESISGRAYRQGWVRTVRVIDFLFRWKETEHCRRAYENDVERARDYLEQIPQWRVTNGD